MSFYIVTKNKDGGFTNSSPLAHSPVVMGMARVVTSDTPPTLDQQKAAFGEDALTIAKKAKSEAIFQAAYAALTAIFSSLPAGPQAQFSPVEEAIIKAAKSGNWTLAADILSTAVVPEALAAAQGAMVSAMTPFLALVTTLDAATTVEQVNTITVS